MARSLQVYPKASIEGATWTFVVKVADLGTDTQTRFTHTVAAGIVALTPLRLLKVVFDLSTPDGVTDQDVDDAMFVDTISRGPNRNLRLWPSWQSRAEANIVGLTPPYTEADFFAAWTTGHTSRTRTDARDILERQRGWTVTRVHQHEGDNTNTEE